MKIKIVIGQTALLVLLAAGIQLPAQQSTTNAVANTDDILPSQRPHFVPNKQDVELGFVPDWATNQKTANPYDALMQDETLPSDLEMKAEKGDAQAQFYFGGIYIKGDGVPQNSSEGVKWIRRAGEQGYAPAQYILGLAYYDGEGVSQDHVEAAKWLLKAANHAYEPAQYNLGLMYYNAKDFADAAKWFLKAAEQGDADAQYEMGNAYELGKGLNENYTEAAKWYSRAAAQGHLFAQCALGISYEFGKGVPENFVEAYKWLNLASAHSANDSGDKTIIESSAVMRDSMVKNDGMTPEEVAQAQQLSEAFIPKKETPGSDYNSVSPVAANSPIATGTGFFITDDGYLISNYHVIKGATQIRLVTTIGTVPAKVVQVDTANDIALLKVEGNFSALPIAASRTAGLGDTVATIGFPDPTLQGFSPKLAKGEIASLSGAADDPKYFQISLPVQPGNSGGALVDAHGNVVGIVSAKLDAATALEASGALPENVNYAVKSSLLLSFLESVPEAKLKMANTNNLNFGDVVKLAQQATVLVLVY